MAFPMTLWISPASVVQAAELSSLLRMCLGFALAIFL
jgi:hypothetical protein